MEGAMMKTLQQFSIRFLIAFFLSFSFSQTSYAEPQNTPANFLVDVGKDHYAKGQKAEAIHELSKALILDPENAEAKKYLHKLGVEEGLYTSKRTSTDQIADLSQHVNTYKQKIVELERQKKDIEDKFNNLQAERNELYRSNLAKDLEMNLLHDKVNQIKEASLKNKDIHQDQMQRIDEMYKDKDQKLMESVIKKEHLVDSMEVALKEKEAQLKSLNSKFNNTIDQSLLYEDQMAALSEKYRQLKGTIDNRHKTQDQLIRNLADYLYMRGEKMNDIADQLVYKEMDLTRTQHSLLNKMDDLVDLHQTADKYRHQISERDALIDDKDADLRFLQNKVNK